MTTPSTPPAIGSIRLLDSATPTLEAGLYRLTSALVVQQKHPPPSQNDPPPSQNVSDIAAPPGDTMHFEVLGPRFTVDRADVGDRYPTPDSKGAFSDRLPHIALDRRTLPWERAAADGTPWLALLVFAADEAKLSTPGALSTLVPATVVTALQGLEPFTDDPTVTVVLANDLPTFRGALPTKQDVKLLAHIRQVNLADTALSGQDDDGIFAIVTANRLPVSSSTDGTPYLACLVSLEGRDDIWSVPDGQQPPPLIVLHSWNFTSTGAGGTFEHFAANLDAAPFGAPKSGSPAVIAADGTISVARTERDGTSDNALYRGPLLGLATGQPLSAGENDISSLAAFELGRLLGASDGRFLRELVAWHRATNTAARTAMVAEEVSRTLNARTARVTRKTRAAKIAKASATASAIKATRVTTASAKSALASLIATIVGRSANRWRVHPAGAAIHEEASRPKRPTTRNAKRRRRRPRRGGRHRQRTNVQASRKPVARHATNTKKVTRKHARPKKRH